MSEERSILSLWYAAHQASHFSPRYLATCPFCHDPDGVASAWLKAGRP